MANKTMHHLVIEDNNYEILDAKNRANIAAEYSASSTYKVGDVVLYNGQLYKCTTAITTAEAWTAAHWTAVTVGGELSSVKDGLTAVEEELTIESSITRNTTTVYPLSWENGTFINGEPVASGWAVRSPDFIEMTDGLTFTAKNIQSGLRLYMAMYDSTKAYLSQINVGVGTLTPTNENCKYVKLCTYSETTPQAQQGSKISATVTNVNSIENTLQTMEVNKTDAFDYTSWIVNGGVLTFKKSLPVGVDVNNSGTATYIYNLAVENAKFTGALIVYCESSDGSRLGSPIQIRVLDENKAFIKTVAFKAGAYPNVYVPAADEKYFTVNLYASADGNLPEPAVFKNLLIAMNGSNAITLYPAIKQSYQCVPDYYFVNDYLPDKVTTIKNLINASDGNYDAFVFCTDQHWTLNAKKSPNLINYLMYNLKMPRMFMGGDYGSGINLQAINAFRDAYEGEIVNVTGNHELQQYYQTEYGVVSGTVTGTMVWAYLDASMTNCVVGNAERNYYYIDNTQQKMRYIVLNDWAKGVSNSTPIYQFEQAQIDWFNSSLLTLPEDYLAVVFIHAISDVNHETGALTKKYAFNAVQTVVDAYSTKVCCIIAGHTHFDGVGATDGGVPVIVTTCDKALPDRGYDDYLTDIRHIGTITEQAFDVIVINKKDKVINAVRIGCPANNPTGSPLEVRTVTYGS